MTPTEIDIVVSLVTGQKWLMASIIVIGLLVRLSKSDVAQRWLTPVPARYRPLVALVLGVASGILEAVAAGTPWLAALLRGLLAAAVAMAGHDVVIEGLLGGREGRSDA